MNVSQLLTSDTPSSREQPEYENQQNMSSEYQYDEAAIAQQQHLEQQRQYEQAPYTPTTATPSYNHSYYGQQSQQGQYQHPMRGASPDRYHEDMYQSHQRNRTPKMLETPGPYAYKNTDQKYVQDYPEDRDGYYDQGRRHGPLASADISTENIIEESRRGRGGAFTSDNLPLYSNYDDPYYPYQSHAYLTPTSNSPSFPREHRGSAGSIRGYGKDRQSDTPSPSEQASEQEEAAAIGLMLLGNASTSRSAEDALTLRNLSSKYPSDAAEEPCDSDSTEEQQIHNDRHYHHREAGYQQEQQQPPRQQEYGGRPYHEHERAHEQRVREEAERYQAQQMYIHQRPPYSLHEPQTYHHQLPPQAHQQPRQYSVQPHPSTQPHRPLSSPIAYKKAKKSHANNVEERHAEVYSDYDRHDGYRSETVKGEKDTDYVDDAPYETPRSMVSAPKRKPVQATKKRSAQKPTQRKASSSSKGGMAPPKLHNLPSANLEAEFDAPPAKVRKTNNSAISSLPEPLLTSMAPPPLVNLAPKSASTASATTPVAIDTQQPRCQRCRKSKKGCDRQRPCGRCRDAGIPKDQCISEDESTIRRGRSTQTTKKKTAPVKLAINPTALEEAVGGHPVGLPAGPLIHESMGPMGAAAPIMMAPLEPSAGLPKAQKTKRKRPVA